MATPTVRIQAPRRLPRKGGITAVAEVFEDPRIAAAGALQYDAEACSLAVGEIQLCYGPDVSAADKTGDGLSAGEGIVPVFGGFVGVQCYAGSTEDEYGPRAKAQLEAVQDRLIESVLWGWLTAEAATGAGATLAAAIGAAEEHADANYVGLPVLHLSREDAVLAAAAGAISPNPADNGKLWTPNGTPVVASSSYASGTVAVSGGVSVGHTPTKVIEGQDYAHNQFLAIAERAYGLAVDCDYRAEFTVTTP